ncbi:hypothetical protein CFOL_v3_23209 [Cephalotus follicularis]|uniref:Putative plant transposon protein domain-containing protein n=1 Tax=Cephalotus follicularis TaxID=3775 RepID=A0A1Q3CHN2_CEPFO|nr:hypothetical protein CFOL_v3_23209 [Cephalotus follicularis]
MVQNKTIDLDLRRLNIILNVPNEGAMGWNQRTWVASPDFDQQDCVRVLFGENADHVQRMYTTNLLLDYRFLHHAVCTHILPKAGGFDEVTHMEAYTMYHMITGRRINVLFLLINHMHSIHDRENAILGYSNIITKILQYFNIDLTGEVHHDLHSADKLGKGTLGRMGFKKHKRTGTWIPRDEDSNRVVEEEGEAEIGEEAENIPLQIEPQAEPIPDVHLPRNRLDEMFDAIKGMQKNIADEDKYAVREEATEENCQKNLLTRALSSMEDSSLHPIATKTIPQTRLQPTIWRERSEVAMRALTWTNEHMHLILFCILCFCYKHPLYLTACVILTMLFCNEFVMFLLNM